jgi:hypothetical protein
MQACELQYRSGNGEADAEGIVLHFLKTQILSTLDFSMIIKHTS